MKPDLDKAREFILGNARLLDRRRFAFQFEDGTAQDVVTALLPYQNIDGGFGQALEPDLRCAASQPVSTEHALQILDELGEFTQQIAHQCCEWLATITTKGGGVPFALASLENAPHAPWWQATGKADLNPTSGIAGLLHKHSVEHPWLTTATVFCWQSLEGGDFTNVGPDDAIFICKFIEWVPERERATAVFDKLSEFVKSNLVAYDPQETGYVKSPLDFAPDPKMMTARLFDSATIETHLDALAERQQDDGGWPISWEPPSTAAISEWRGFVTLKSLDILDKYGRLS